MIQTELKASMRCIRTSPALFLPKGQNPELGQGSFIVLVDSFSRWILREKESLYSPSVLIFVSCNFSVLAKALLLILAVVDADRKALRSLYLSRYVAEFEHAKVLRVVSSRFMLNYR